MSSTTARQRYVLLPTATPRESEAKVRRYRLARLRIETLRRDATGPFAHLKRTYD
ncbi:MAG: hypothetical protein JHC84_14500 [Solirubrobacteraceae bacterium]|nr:hypothetical protein [Solirubrobacteraceae bacterium]